MLRAFKLYTGPDNASHLFEGAIEESERTDVVAIHFKESPPHASFEAHKWRLIDGQPWRRAYVVLKPGVPDSFVPRSA